jgi:type IV pilus assembly protein PilP
MRYFAIFSVVLTLSACQPKVDDLQTYVAQVKQNTQVNIEPYPEFREMPAFKYEAKELRSPFQRPRNLVLEQVTAPKVNCLQPNFGRNKQPLEQYGLDALSVIGEFTTNGNQYALIQANDNSLHKVKAGNRIGLFFGTIDRVDSGTLFITEMLPDGTGCWQVKKTTLSMSSNPGETDNV